MDLQSFAHGFGQLCFHIVFCPKYRKPIFRDYELKSACERILREVASKYGFTIYELEVNKDHVHLFVGFRPNLSVSYVTQLFKGISAYRLFREFSWLRKTFRKGHLWSEGKFYRSVGNTTADVVKHYIACSQGNWSNVFKVSEFSDIEPDIGQLTLSDWLM